MLDLLLATLVVLLLVATALAVLAALTLVPFVVALQMADSRGFSTTRWGAVALAGSVLGLALALLVWRSDAPTVAALLPLVLVLVGPGVLWLLTPDQVGIGGRAGRHEAG